MCIRDSIVIDTLIAFIHRTIGWAIGRRVPLVFLEMPYETSPFLRYYEAAFGLLPTFGAEVAVLGFDADLLDAPLLRTPVDLEAYIGESPTNFFSIRDHGSTTADQVRRILDAVSYTHLNIMVARLTLVAPTAYMTGSGSPYSSNSSRMLVALPPR